VKYSLACASTVDNETASETRVEAGTRDVDDPYIAVANLPRHLFIGLASARKVQEPIDAISHVMLGFLQAQAARGDPDPVVGKRGQSPNLVGPRELSHLLG
jgi:hypothetical protein